MDSEVNDLTKWTQLEPSEIATKCACFDSANKLFGSRTERKPEAGPQNPHRGSGASALSKSLDNEAARGMPFPNSGFMPPAWQPRSRAAGGLSSSLASGFDDASGSPYAVGSHFPTRMSSRVNGAHGSVGTETIGFYGEEESIKPREYATDAPFTTRSSASDASASGEAKHTLESEAPEAIAALERYA